MPFINIDIKNKVAVCDHEQFIVGGNADYVVDFRFDEEWEAFDAKVARFIWNNGFEDVTFSGNECPIPIIANTNSVLVGVYVNDILRTTTRAVVRVKKSILCDNIPEGGTIIVKGDNGKSAYEIAVKNGFEGTEQEWIDIIAHPNKTTLDKFTEQDGKLMFNGSEIAEKDLFVVNLTATMGDNISFEVTEVGTPFAEIVEAIDEGKYVVAKIDVVDAGVTLYSEVDYTVPDDEGNIYAIVFSVKIRAQTDGDEDACYFATFILSAEGDCECDTTVIPLQGHKHTVDDITDFDDTIDEAMEVWSRAIIGGVDYVFGLCEQSRNKVTEITADSTDEQYPSAKAVYDLIGDDGLPSSSIPNGSNAGDVLVWNGTEWNATPTWQLIYRPIEYVENTESLSIKIADSFVFDADLRMVIDFQFLRVPNGGEILSGASFVDNGKSHYYFCGVNKNNFRVSVGEGSGLSIPGVDTNRHIWDVQSGSQKLDGVEQSNLLLTISFNKPLYVFGYYSTNLNSFAKARIFSAKYYRQDELVYDLVPVHNILNGSKGLYDKVAGRFYEFSEKISSGSMLMMSAGIPATEI